MDVNILCTSFLISHRNIFCDGENRHGGILSEKSEFVNKLRLFLIPVKRDDRVVAFILTLIFKYNISFTKGGK